MEYAWKASKIQAAWDSEDDWDKGSKDTQTIMLLRMFLKANGPSRVCTKGALTFSLKRNKIGIEINTSRNLLGLNS